MHADRGQIMLARKREGEGFIRNQSQPVAIAAVYGVDLRQPFGLLLQFAWQIGHLYGADTDNTVAQPRHSVKRGGNCPACWVEEYC